MRQTRYSGNKYWTDLIYHHHDQSSSPPTVTTDELTMGNPMMADVDGTVVGKGSSDLTSYGFVYADHDNPTLDDHVAEVGTDGSFTGSFTKHITSLPFASLLYFRAYATNASGTSYGEVLSDEPMICLAGGTRILSVSGEKNIEDVSYNDDLLIWNFDEARMGVARPAWMVEPFQASRYGLVRFSDGSELKTVADGKGHRIFNIERSMFTYMMAEDTPIGTRTVAADGRVVSVTSKEVVEEETTFYNVITAKHMNVFANNLLTSTGLNNLYPIVDMKFIKETRRVRMKEEFGVSDELFEGFRLSEQPVSYPDLYRKIKRLARRQLVK